MGQGVFASCLLLFGQQSSRLSGVTLMSFGGSADWGSALLLLLLILSTRPLIITTQLKGTHTHKPFSVCARPLGRIITLRAHCIASRARSDNAFFLSFSPSLSPRLGSPEFAFPNAGRHLWQFVNRPRARLL